MIKALHAVHVEFHLIFKLLCQRGQAVYRPINGGYGQIYDVIYLFTCRILKSNIFIHHHSFNYLNSYSRLFRLLLVAAGGRVTHVVLGEKMKADLCTRYSLNPANIIIVSNLAFFDNANSFEHWAGKSLVLGHLANLSVEKGVDDFISVCRALSDAGISFKGVIAGPISDAGSSSLIEAACLEMRQVEYIGPVYGDAKVEFFRSLDIFVFLSKYKNEAEPLVLYEAAEHGVFLIGTERGCMAPVIKSLHGFVVEDCSDTVSEVVLEIYNIIDGDVLTCDAREYRRGLFNAMRSQAAGNLKALINLMGEKFVSGPV
ncbi:hypothetical protein Maes01_01602 [Microbulbifer aestuariivivens]|uniref:Glycosyl transferase family 1 domain-containing protein n=2 Tax=Microbulbifer aestuariivivens TaxID=1908308 RepID=A0ABP9WPC8_9GAMM